MGLLDIKETDKDKEERKWSAFTFLKVSIGEISHDYGTFQSYRNFFKCTGVAICGARSMILFRHFVVTASPLLSRECSD